MSETSTIVSKVCEALRSLSLRNVVIALGGSYAKGNADALSDIDFYVFATEFPAPELLTRHLAELLPEAGEFASWANRSECGIDLHLHGLTVEIWFRQTDEVLAGAYRALSGAVEREDRVWTPNGFYRYAALSDLSSMSVLVCLDDKFAAALSDVRAYPEALRHAVFSHGLHALEFWRGNLHLDTAIARQDRYYLESIYHQIRSGLVQCAFAANRKYFGGDKKLQESLEQMDSLPKGFIEVILPQGMPSLASSSEWRSRFEQAFAAADCLKKIYEQVGRETLI